MTATEADIARRAGAMCIAAEPHEDKTEWPCARHKAEAARQLGIHSSAPASSLVVSGSAATGTGFDGAAGVRVPVVPASGQGAGGSTSQTDNRPGTLNPRPAYRPNDLGQTGR